MVVERIPIVTLGVEATVPWCVLFHEPVNQTSHCHRVKPLLRVIPVDLYPQMLNSSFRIASVQEPLHSSN